MLRNVLTEVVNYLKMRNIYLSTTNEWLSGCCNYYPNNTERYNIQDLETFVYEQWLLADLHDVAEACLPPNLSEIEKTILHGKYTLQVDVILNISESCYTQLQKIDKLTTITSFSQQNQDTENVEVKSRRMLKLTCTDGIRTVYAIEYEQLNQLRDPFIPGFKILVTGPVECRRGVLLLKPVNLIVLGGEADNLIDENSTRNVLSKILNTHTNVNSCPKKETAVYVERTSERADDSITPANLQILNENVPTRPIVPKNIDNRPDDDVLWNVNSERFANTVINDYNNYYNESKQVSGSNRHQICDNEEVRMNVEMQPSNSLRTNSHFVDFVSKRETLASNNKELTMAFHSKSDKMPAPVVGIACPIVSSNNREHLASTLHPTTKVTRSSFAYSSDTNREKKYSRDVLFTSGTIDRNAHENWCPTSTMVSVIGKESSAAESEIATNNEHTCHARVCRLTSKPRIRNGLWQLSAEISDRNEIIPVSFSNSVLETIFGYSALEVSSQKERMKCNSNVKERIDQILKDGVEKILSLKGIFKLQRSQNNDESIVTKVISQKE